MQGSGKGGGKNLACGAQPISGTCNVRAMRTKPQNPKCWETYPPTYSKRIKPNIALLIYINWRPWSHLFYLFFLFFFVFFPLTLPFFFFGKIALCTFQLFITLQFLHFYALESHSFTSSQNYPNKATIVVLTKTIPNALAPLNLQRSNWVGHKACNVD